MPSAVQSALPSAVAADVHRPTADIPVARVLTPRPSTLTQRLLDAIRTLEQRVAEDWAACSDVEMWKAVGGVQALLGVLEMMQRGER